MRKFLLSAMFLTAPFTLFFAEANAQEATKTVQAPKAAKSAKAGKKAGKALKAAKAAEAKLPRPVAKLELADGDGIVFLGDSITHQCLYTQYVEDFLYTRYPSKRFRFHNSGVGGDRANDALIRFDQDVASLKPKYVTVLLGMNDGSYQPFNQQVFDTYERDMKKVLEQIQSTGATAVLMTPTMFDARAARVGGKRDDNRNTYYNATLAYYGAWLREIAVEQGLGFVDMYSPLNNLTLKTRKNRPGYTLIKDAVHPDAPGQVVMAVAILESLVPDRVVSNTQVILNGGSTPTINTTKAKATNAETDGDNVSFTLLAEALPWVLPADAQPGYQLTAAGHRHSREAVQVIGLKPGSYELRIDGNVVGSYTSEALSRGVELQSNDKTPQYQQALKVATLNKQRNDEAVHPLRDLWYVKKTQRGAQAALKAKPDDENAAKSLEAINKKLENFDEQIAKLQEKAKGIEDQIYQVNKPTEHRYELTRSKN